MLRTFFSRGTNFHLIPPCCFPIVISTATFKSTKNSTKTPTPASKGKKNLEKKQVEISTPTSEVKSEIITPEIDETKTFKLTLAQIKTLSSTLMQLGGTYKARDQASDFFRATAMLRVSEQLGLFCTQKMAMSKADPSSFPISVHDLNVFLKLNKTSSILKRILDFAKEQPQQQVLTETSPSSSKISPEPKGNSKKREIVAEHEENKITLLLDDDVHFKKSKNNNVLLLQELNSIKTDFPHVASVQFITSVLGFGIKAATGIASIVVDKDCAHYFANVLRSSNGKIDNIVTFRKVLAIWDLYPTVMNRVLSERYGYRRLFPLSPTQKLGLKYYTDLMERIPRQEVAEHEKLLTAAGANIGLSVQICGSYRRGLPTCGDVDCIVWSKHHKSEAELNSLLSKFLKGLDLDGKIDDKKNRRNNNNKYILDSFAEGERKFMGLCRLPPVLVNGKSEARKVRRLDIRIIPRELVPTMLLYFTGSASHNVHMRQIAIGKKMLLNEYGLFKLLTNSALAASTKNKYNHAGSNNNVDGKKRIPVTSEEDVFKELGMKYVEPKDRE